MEYDRVEIHRCEERTVLRTITRQDMFLCVCLHVVNRVFDEVEVGQAQPDELKSQPSA